MLSNSTEANVLDLKYVPVYVLEDNCVATEEMDPEKQPLLKSKEYLRQRFRPLTSQEVLHYHYDDTWRRVQVSLLFIFWSLIATSVIIITWLLAAAPPCVDTGLEREPTVSPAHLSLVPLVYSGRTAEPLV